MDFVHYEPTSEILKEYVDFFYFVKQDCVDQVSFFAFPHINKPVNIHRNIDFVIGKNETLVVGKSGMDSNVLIQGAFEEPLLVKFLGKIDKVTILFKDGAVCNFIDKYFENVAPLHTQLLLEWEQNPKYNKFVHAFFSSENHQEQLLQLESFLLSILNEKGDWKLYKKASALLQNVESSVRISEIANDLCMSERTLYRLIYKYNGISPMNYKKIVQFRHSLKNQLISEQFKMLTDIAHESNYYDSSHFNKIYKSLTKKNPGSFFDNLSKYCNQKLIFENRKNV